ncbi:MAG: hypothetical protein AAF449_02220 [Myxococcota bacterium]
MRGRHYGADYRWFDRFIGQRPVIPQVTPDPNEVDQLLYERGVERRPMPEEPEVSPAIETSRQGFSEPTMSRSTMEARLGASTSRFPPGSLKAAMYQRAPSVVSASSSPYDQTPPVTDRVMKLAELIRTSLNARELAEYSLEELLGAFRAARVNPSASAKLVQAWGFRKQLSPEELVSVLQRAKDDWVAVANVQKDDAGHAWFKHAAVDAWNRDDAIADMLGQRRDVSHEAKNIDRERLTSLRRLLASFSDQKNGGRGSANTVALAAAMSGGFS